MRFSNAAWNYGRAVFLEMFRLWVRSLSWDLWVLLLTLLQNRFALHRWAYGNYLAFGQLMDTLESLLMTLEMKSHTLGWRIDFWTTVRIPPWYCADLCWKPRVSPKSTSRPWTTCTAARLKRKV